MKNAVIELVSPVHQHPLTKNTAGSGYETPDRDTAYPIKNGVVDFLNQADEFYEGAYLNRIKYVPASEHLTAVWPIWLINSGYLWEVRKQFRSGAVLLELGCASGIDYFAQRYQMVGLDLSLKSLAQLPAYKLKIRADALALPFPDETFDGVISSYFWEHIAPPQKKILLQELRRVLKKDGRLVFLYDVDTQNGLLRGMKRKKPERYEELFIAGDQHYGYETPAANRSLMEAAGYRILLHEGMERTIFQSASVYEKLRREHSLIGLFSRIMWKLNTQSFMAKLYLLFLRVVDSSVGKMIGEKQARIILTVAQKL